MVSEKPCVFCAIRDGEPAAWVLNDENVLAFLDTHPLFPGHVLVVPRNHHRNIFTLPPEDNAELFAVVQRMSEAVKTAMKADGVLVISNNGVSQSVDHLHIHVVPRRKKDGLRGFMWPRGKYADGEAQGVADRIAQAYGAQA